MRCLVLSDVHANIDALDAVLADAVRHGDLRVLMLGDLVGYGAAPNAVIERFMGLSVAAAIRGNHDRAACGLDDAESFNEVARASALATGHMLTPAHREFLKRLPAGPLAVSALTEICHGSPFDEDQWYMGVMVPHSTAEAFGVEMASMKMALSAPGSEDQATEVVPQVVVPLTS